MAGLVGGAEGNVVKSVILLSDHRNTAGVMPLGT